MKSLLLVLFRSLARFFVRAAEILARWAAPPPAGPEKVRLPWREASTVGGDARGPVPGRTLQAPPEDWLRRALPPPPEHWLRVVRARAPHFLPAPPEIPPGRHSLPSLRSKLPERVSPGPSIFMPQAKEEVSSRDPGRAMASEDARRRHSVLPRPDSARANLRRVTTIIQEEPVLRKRKQGPAPGGAAKSPGGEDVLGLPPDSPVLPAEAGQELEAAPFRLPDERPAAALGERSPEAALPKAPLEHRPTSERWGRDTFPEPPASRGARAHPEAQTILGTFPELPSLSFAASPEREAPSFSWPRLPEPHPESLQVRVQRSLREARDLEELKREQEGLPWNA